MKKIATLLLFFISLTVLAQVNHPLLNKFQKEYNALEFKMKTDAEDLNYTTTKKMNQLSYDVKTELNELQAKYGSNNLKLMIYQKKYEQETVKVKNKYEVKIAKIQGEHQMAMSKIQYEFETEKNKLMLKYQIGK